VLLEKMETERFFLRTLIPGKDRLQNYLTWMTDKASNPFIQGIREDTNLQDLEEYIEAKNSSLDAILLGIFLRDSFEHIGNVKLEPIFEGQDATLGILIGEKSWRGKGVGFEVISRIIVYSFQELNLRKLNLGVDTNNTPAISLYQKLGFRQSNDVSDAESGILMILEKS
jgi:ribosomal-protein-alanine N-acetyltransferase